jgi:predicted ATPase
MHEQDYRAGNPGASERPVVVSGCSGGGKSALLAAMARRGYPVMPEPGRQIVKEQAFIGGDALPWGNIEQFVELCVSRAAYFYNSAPPGRPVLFDRSIVDAVSALAQGGLSIPGHLRLALQRYRYAETVFLAPPWPELFVKDAERRHGFADAVAEYDALLQSYPAHGYAVVEIPRLGVEARADFLEQRLARMASGTKNARPL